jgi:hypothetical protein
MGCASGEVVPARWYDLNSGYDPSTSCDLESWRYWLIGRTRVLGTTWYDRVRGYVVPAPLAPLGARVGVRPQQDTAKMPAQALCSLSSDSTVEDSCAAYSSRSSQQSRLLLRRRHAVSVTGTDGQHSYRTAVTGAFTTAQNSCPCVALAAPKKRYYSKVVQTTV